jgi:hypothetical protein
VAGEIQQIHIRQKLVSRIPLSHLRQVERQVVIGFSTGVHDCEGPITAFVVKAGRAKERGDADESRRLI